MKVTAISATYGRKHNLGNYNSVHVEVSMWADVDEDEDIAMAALDLRKMCRDEVKGELMRLVKDDAESS